MNLGINRLHGLNSVRLYFASRSNLKENPSLLDQIDIVSQKVELMDEVTWKLEFQKLTKIEAYYFNVVNSFIYEGEAGYIELTKSQYLELSLFIPLSAIIAYIYDSYISTAAIEDRSESSNDFIYAMH